MPLELLKQPYSSRLQAYALRKLTNANARLLRKQSVRRFENTRPPARLQVAKWEEEATHAATRAIGSASLSRALVGSLYIKINIFTLHLFSEIAACREQLRRLPPPAPGATVQGL